MKLIDLTGQKFNRLTVISRAPFNSRNGLGEAQWFCKCDCGNFTTVPGYKLRTGKIKSCGCLRKQNTSQKSTKIELGNTYGLLKVIAYAGSDNRYAIWKCRCQCGTEIIVRGSNLRSGNTTSCGCHTISKGELLIKQFLENKHINFVQQKSFNKLVGDTSYPLKFDFYLPQYNMCIEYQGEQHFKSVEYFGGVQEFLRRQSYDQKKQKYCQEHNIKLVYINYNDNIQQKLQELYATVWNF